MGCIKQKFIKRTGKALVEKYPGRFKIKFEENKKELQQLITDGDLNSPSKMIRNRLAGFVTRQIIIAKGLNVKNKQEL